MQNYQLIGSGDLSPTIKKRSKKRSSNAETNQISRTLMDAYHISLDGMNLNLPHQFSFVLRNGVCKNLDDIAENFSNSLAVISKFILIYIPLILFKTFSKISNLLYGIICILQMTNVLNSPWSPKTYAFPVIFYFSITIIIEFWLAIKNFVHLKRVDKEIVLKASGRHSSFVNTEYGRLEVGDIIKISKGESFPADVLILDANEKIHGDVAAMISTSLVSGLKDPVFKKAMNCTKIEPDAGIRKIIKGKIQDYMKTLNGKFTIEYPTTNIRQFKGTLKMKNDPKVSVINIDNLALRGSVLLSDWVIGVVIYTGFHSKCLFGNSFLKIKKPSYLRQHAINYLILVIFLYSVLVAIVSMLQIISHESSFKITRTISMLLPLIPMNLWFVLEISLIINKLIIERQSKKLILTKEPLKSNQKIKIERRGSIIATKLNLKSSRNQEIFEIFDIESIADFGLAEYAIFDKTGTIVTNDFEIKSICVVNKRFDIDQKVLRKIINEIDLHLPTHRQIRRDLRKSSEHDLVESDPSQIEYKSIEETGWKAINNERLENKLQNLNIPNNLISAELNKSLQDIKYENIEISDKHNLTKKQSLYTSEKSNLLTFNKTTASQNNNNTYFRRMSSQTNIKNIALSLAYQIEKDYKEEDFFNDTVTANKSVIFLLKLFALCHNSSVLETAAESNEFNRHSVQIENLNAKEKALVLFADELGFSLISRMVFNSYNECIGIAKLKNRKNEIEEYEILGIITPTFKRLRFSIVLSNKKSKKTICISKGEPDVMLDTIFWNETNLSSYNKLLNKNVAEGLKTVVFGFKYIDVDQVEEFKKRFKNAKTSLLNQEMMLENIGLEIEKDLEYIGMVGFKDLIKSDASRCIQTLKKSGVKMLLLTGDNKSNSLNAAINSKMLEKKLMAITFDFKNEELGKSAFRNLFKKLDLQDGTACSNIFNIFIAGWSVNIIQSSLYLQEHFRFLMNFCECLIGHDLNPVHKEFLVNLLRSNCGTHEPIIIAFGDGYNDYGMLKSAHFGIQIKNKGSNIFNFGNAIAPDFKFITDLFQNHAKQFTYNIYIIIDYLIYSSMFQGFILFFYDILSNFCGIPLYQNIHIFLDQNILHVLPSILFIFINKPHDPSLLNKSNKLHYENMKLKDKLFSCFVFSFLLALIQSIIFVITLQYFMLYGVNADGKFVTLEELFVAIKFYSILITKLRIILLAQAHHLIFFALMWLDIGILIGFEVGLTNLNNKVSLSNRFIFFEHPQTVVLTLSLALICFAANFLLERYVFQVMKSVSFGSRYLRHTQDLSKSVSMRLKIFQNATTIILSSFKKTSRIDNYLNNMLRSLINKNQKNDAFTISKYFLMFKHPIHQKLYQIHFLSKNLFFTRVLSIFITITSFIYILCSNAMGDDILFAAQIMGIFISTISTIFMFSWRFKAYFKFYMISLFILLALLKMILEFFIHSSNFCIQFLLVICYATYFNVNFWIIWIIFCIDGIMCFADLLTTRHITFNHIIDENNKLFAYVIITYTIILVGVKTLEGYQIFNQEKKLKKNFLKKTTFQEGFHDSREILSMLMPEFVLKRMNSYAINENLIADDANGVTILFCDIVDFDQLIFLYNDDIIQLLDEIFRTFDSLCKKHGVQKIETVGKTYMACGGLEFSEEELSHEKKQINSTKRVLNLAIEMMSYAKQLTLSQGMKLKLKIGINYGNAMFGVIGYHKPQFSLIGDAVNTTSRLCTTGVEEHVMVSESAWKIVGSSKLNAEVKETEMKGKGYVKVYHIHQDKKNLFKKRFFLALDRLKSTKSQLSILEKDILVFLSLKTKLEQKDIKKIYEKQHSGAVNLFQLIKRLKTGGSAQDRNNKDSISQNDASLKNYGTPNKHNSPKNNASLKFNSGIKNKASLKKDGNINNYTGLNNAAGSSNSANLKKDVNLLDNDNFKHEFVQIEQKKSSQMDLVQTITRVNQKKLSIAIHRDEGVVQKTGDDLDLDDANRILRYHKYLLTFKNLRLRQQEYMTKKCILNASTQPEFFISIQAFFL